jgi:MoaA/NifB/PqqE/SkfB family radical SAM enzyme/SAM-dependent methyltransferase
VTFEIEKWRRLEFEEIPIYLRPEEPNWFVPNREGDRLLRKSIREAEQDNPEISRFLGRLPARSPEEYFGRAASLKLDRLSELWFHLTNRCNLSCAHCLFCSSPQDAGELSSQQVLEAAAEGHRLGCRVFALTGGEPFIHPEIRGIINGLLALPKSHVVVLTNGMNLPEILKSRQFDRERLHLQISMDGMEETHDAIRGRGTFRKLGDNLQWLGDEKIPYTVSMCVTHQNVKDMPGMVDLAANLGSGNVHFMWYFIRGRGRKEEFPTADEIFENLVAAAERAEEAGILIDNIEALKTQIFAPPGTIHDGTTAGWESLAVGPDFQIYPSAALIGIPELAVDLTAGLESAWRESSVLANIRNCTTMNLDSPFRFLLGGGDIDHSYIHNRTFMGDDPYHPLHEKVALWLITREAARQTEDGPPRMRLRMGEILESCGAHGKVALVHSNCLLATAQENSLKVVKSFYSEAAGDKNEDILNPVCYEEELIRHIPQEFRFRGYGCGSPVLDADVQTGEHVVDLGCGSGVECFVAARLTGASGRVTGVDMLDPMLELAHKGLDGVVENLGFRNIEFKKGYLEELPLEDNSVDVVLSNCVMNLSVHKRRAYAEIYRVLRPGGRLVISDVVCENDPDPTIRNDETLRGECIAGAMTQSHLLALLEETGFSATRLIKRFPYRNVQGHPFFSLTYSAFKAAVSEQVRVLYRGPSPHLVTPRGIRLFPGVVQTIPEQEAELLGEQIFILDESGFVTNVEAENTCACYLAPEERETSEPSDKKVTHLPRKTSGCMVCGAPIEYFSEEEDHRCSYCLKTFSANSSCEKGHFVCDACHEEDGLEIIRHICLHTEETDMLRLFEQIRSHPAIPVNGPEHHALVPGVILATYRNLGGSISATTIEIGIKRGSSVAGGYCAFMGICGAAVGVGTAFSLILDANPLKPEERKKVQQAVQKVLGEIAELRAARCCQRDCWIALIKAAELSAELLPLMLRADEDLLCGQQHQNHECQGRECPLMVAGLSAKALSLQTGRGAGEEP